LDSLMATAFLDCSLPLSAANDPAFRAFLRSLQPLYTPPTRTQLSAIMDALEEDRAKERKEAAEAERRKHWRKKPKPAAEAKPAAAAGGGSVSAAVPNAGDGADGDRS
jgi:hypothetical protein